MPNKPPNCPTVGQQKEVFDMKPKQAVRKLRSLYHRQQLLEDLPTLEKEVIEFIEETGTRALAGYKVEVENGKVKIVRLQINSHQLDFEFMQEESWSGQKPP